MDSFWAKMAVFGIIVGGLVVFVKLSPKLMPKPQPQKTVYDSFARDDKKFRPTDQERSREVAEPQPAAVQKPQPAATEEPQPEVKKTYRQLSEEEDIQAQKLLEQAIFHRKEVRLGGMGAKYMVDFCREIIQKYPGTIYEEKARLMLGDIPERFRDRFHITPEEINPTK